MEDHCREKEKEYMVAFPADAHRYARWVCADAVGLKFNPVYNAQWKETGEWQQSYYAYPEEGYHFVGWFENGEKVSEDEVWIDEYGTSRVLKALFDTEN